MHLIDRRRRELSLPVYALIVSLYLALVANLPLLRGILTTQADDGSLASSVVVVGVTFIVLVVVQLILLLFLAGDRTLQFTAVVFALIVAALSYFDQKMGVIFDKEMIRNIADTVIERNAAEAGELLSISLVVYVLFFSAPVIGFALWFKVRPEKWYIGLRNRFAVLALGIAVMGVALGVGFRDFSYFWREHRDQRVHAIPLFPVISFKQFVSRSLKQGETFVPFSDSVHRFKVTKKPLLAVLVVGETARADHFSLNGYGRNTNPYLQTDDVVSFEHVTSCGTSTAYSVPCIFSLDSGSNYDPDSAANKFNVLDVLTKAGIDVEWIDANSGCKGVCRRIKTINLAETDRPGLGDNIFDEELLPYLSQANPANGEDMLVVMHMLGSHGPSYSERYPDPFGKFIPFCTNAAPQECDNQAVVNAYDNSIAYTDYVLHEMIKVLEAKRHDFETVLVYVSDHGESLGENGVYLHGWPNAIAPVEQRAVPVIAWVSDEFMRDKGLSKADLTSRGTMELSHDAISHTLLGMFDVTTSVYDANLDIFRESTSRSGGFQVALTE